MPSLGNLSSPFLCKLQHSKCNYLIIETLRIRGILLYFEVLQEFIYHSTVATISMKGEVRIH